MIPATEDIKVWNDRLEPFLGPKDRTERSKLGSAKKHLIWGEIFFFRGVFVIVQHFLCSDFVQLRIVLRQNSH